MRLRILVAAAARLAHGADFCVPAACRKLAPGADDGGCCTIPPARPTRTPWAPIALVIVLGLAAAIRRR